jgi:RNA-dependent RNA polymerase
MGIYFAIFEPLLLPTQHITAAEYQKAETPANKVTCSPSGIVHINEIASFFVYYLKNDNLGRIANSWLVFADISSNGALCDECLQLAALHSISVDFVKTGVPAELPFNLIPHRNPHLIESIQRILYQQESVGRTL